MFGGFYSIANMRYDPWQWVKGFLNTGKKSEQTPGSDTVPNQSKPEKKSRVNTSNGCASSEIKSSEERDETTRLQTLTKTHHPEKSHKAKREYSILMNEDSKCHLKLEHNTSTEDRDERYKTGAYGLVKKAWNRDGKCFAVKIFPRGGSQTYAENFVKADSQARQKIIKQCMNEVAAHRAMGREAHVFDREDSKKIYVIMPYFKGRDLYEIIEDKENKIDKKPLRQIVRMMLSLLEDVAVLHRQGWIINDISDSNVIYDEKETLSLIDFGAAYNEKNGVLKDFTNIAFNLWFLNKQDFERAMKHQMPAHSRRKDLNALAIVFMMILKNFYDDYAHFPGEIKLHKQKKYVPEVRRHIEYVRQGLIFQDIDLTSHPDGAALIALKQIIQKLYKNQTRAPQDATALYKELQVVECMLDPDKKAEMGKQPAKQDKAGNMLPGFRSKKHASLVTSNTGSENTELRPKVQKQCPHDTTVFSESQRTMRL